MIGHRQDSVSRMLHRSITSAASKPTLTHGVNGANLVLLRRSLTTGSSRFSHNPSLVQSTLTRKSSFQPCLFSHQRYSTSTDPAPARPDPIDTLTSHEGVREKFERLGLNANICKQLTSQYPHIIKPTSAQSALIPAILSPNDLILRAHTGTGKSFGILLALLAKPRIVFRETPVMSSSKPNEKGKATEKPPSRKTVSGISSILLVPSNELAFQYMRWARTLFPSNVLPSLDPVIQCLVRGPSVDGLTAEQEQFRLKNSPPHILIGTPNRIKDILDTPVGPMLLGVETLRTLVLDEADSLLQLPGRFPSAKQRWKHQNHRTPGLEILNAFMKSRATYSGGEKVLDAGLENRPGRVKDEKRPPEHIRRHQYQAAENPETGYALPKRRSPGVQPLQLICTSATANSVMRHFFGARTGWLRTGIKDSSTTRSATGRIMSSNQSQQQSARWIDLTGLSGHNMVEHGFQGLFGDVRRSSNQANQLISEAIQKPSLLPAGIQHTCIVVDEAPLSRVLQQTPLRNLRAKLAKRRPDKVQILSEDGSSYEQQKQDPEDESEPSSHYPFVVVKPENEPAEHELDQKLIEALAFCFASEGVSNGLALIPPRWSLLKTRAAFEALGLSVKLPSDPLDQKQQPSQQPRREQEQEQEKDETDPVLHLLQTTSARGLDLPGLSHVFLVGFHSVIDAVQYTHMAGRVGRVSSSNNNLVTGKVITLIAGIPHNLDWQPTAAFEFDKSPISIWEQKMGHVYRRLGLVPKRLDLQLLKVQTEQISREQEQEQGQEQEQEQEQDVEQSQQPVETNQPTDKEPSSSLP